LGCIILNECQKAGIVGRVWDRESGSRDDILNQFRSIMPWWSGMDRSTN
jgi:hypothetical protein